MTIPGPLDGDDRPSTGPDADLFAVREPVPAVPAYEPTELLDPTPAYDSLAGETLITPLVVEETNYFAEPPVEAGPLAAVKAFAAQRPAAFLGAALVLGWLVGKVFSASDGDE